MPVQDISIAALAAPARTRPVAPAPAAAGGPWEPPAPDALTGLATRAQLLGRAARALRSARLTGRRVALMVLDIDCFKGINDSLGHEVGDWFLRTCAARIRAAVYLDHTVARIGNDEFAVLLEGVRDRDETAALAERLLAAVAAPATHGCETVVATASAGLAVFPGDGLDESALLGHAALALSRAQAGGGNALCFYEASMAGSRQRHFTLSQGLRGALAGNQLDLHYQPIVALDGLRVCGMEALMRWTLPGGASVPPCEFIPVAEQSGMIVGMGQHVLRQACGQIGAWRGAGLDPVPVAINLSPRQLSQPDIVDSVFGALDDSGLEPESVELEITESMAMGDGDDALAKLRRMADRGLRLAIDDFGTGHSSLSRLQKLPVHTLKIDRSFTSELGGGEAAVAVVRAIVALARALHMETIAEGVETREQLNILQALGCDRCQGYLISRPVSSHDARRMLEARPRR